MKSMGALIFSVVAVGFALTALCGKGDTMNDADIKEFLQKVDDGLPQGRIYRINYSVIEVHSPAFYEHKRQLIKLINRALLEEADSLSATPTGQKRRENLKGLIECYNLDLKVAPKISYDFDYSLSGGTFYVKKEMQFDRENGSVPKSESVVYCSDGKIMGTFDPVEARAVLQPATERPPLVQEFWTETAYTYMHTRIAAYFALWAKLGLSEGDGTIVVSADQPGQKQARSHMEWTLDKQTLLPKELVSYYYPDGVNKDAEWVKTWQFADYEGVRLPKKVVDLTYAMDVNKSWNLECEKTFTINEFTLTPKDGRVELQKLLADSYSVFDEITGSHYISGKVDKALDNLSK